MCVYVCLYIWLLFILFFHCYCGGAFKNVIREFQVSRFSKSKIARNTKCAKIEHHPITKHNVQQLKHKPYTVFSYVSYFFLAVFCVGVRALEVCTLNWFKLLSGFICPMYSSEREHAQATEQTYFERENKNSEKQRR